MIAVNRSYSRFISTTLALCALLYSIPALAVDSVLYDETSPAMGMFRPSFNTSFEDYDPYSGQYTTSHADVVIPDSSGLDLQVIRTSNRAISTVKERLIDDHTNSDVLGKFWMLTFGGLNKKVGPNGVITPYFYTPKGNVKQFYKPSISNTGALGISRDFWRYNKTEVYSYKDNGERHHVYDYELKSPDGRSYWFSYPYKDESYPEDDPSHTLLTKVTDKSGAYYTISYGTISLTRDRKDENEYHEKLKYISSVTHSNGTTLKFNYSKMKTLKDDYYILTSITSSGRTLVSYQYKQSAGEYVLNKTVYADGTSWTDDTSPLGAKVTYSHSKSSFSINRASSKRLKKKTLAIPSYGNIVTNYSYANANKNKEVVVKVTGSNYCHVSTYFSNSQGDLYLAGSLKSTITYGNSNCSSNKLRQTDYAYQPLKISKENQILHFRFGSNSSSNTYKPLTTRVTVTDFKTDGQDQFITNYSGFDTYGNAQVTSEYSRSYSNSTGQWVNHSTRTTRRTFENNTSKWVLGLVKTQSIDGIAGQVSYGYNSNGQVISKNEYGLTTHYSYDSKGNLTSTTDPLNNKTYYSNYYLGTPRSVTGPESYNTTRVVDGFGNTTSETQWGTTTNYAYDAMHRVTAIKTPSTTDYDTTAAYAKNSEGFRQTITRGFNKTEKQFNGIGQLIWQKQTNAGGNPGTPITSIVYFKYDDMGNQIFVSYPNDSAHGTSTAYDALGRVTKMTASDGSAVTYQYLAGNKVKTIEQEGNIVIQTYLSWGSPSEQHLVKTEQLGTTGNANAIVSDAITTRIVRNNLGLIRFVIQGGFVQTYAYTPSWQLDYVHTPETGKTNVLMDANGNTIEKQVGNNPKTTYTYDKLNRLINVNYPGSTKDVNYHYNAKGQLEWVKKGNYQWSYRYNPNGTMIAETLTDSASNKSWPIGYTLDRYDHITTVRYPGNFNVDYQPDSAGRPTKAGAYASNLQYNASGTLTSLNYGNGRKLAIGKDSRQRPNHVVVDNNILNISYGYYKDSDIKSITDHLNSSNNLSMQYDQHHRLREVEGPLWGTGTVKYDVNGNITKKTTYDIRMNYHYSKTNNRLTDIGGDDEYTYGYDGYGNVISNGYYTFTYDHDGTMQDAKNNQNQYLFEYSYDAYNRRVTQSEKGQLKKYSIYDKAGQLLLEEDKNGKRSYFVYAAGQRIAAAKPTEQSVTYYHNDLLGSPAAATDKTGKLLWRENYLPFGKKVKNQDQKTGNDIGYTGHVHDEDTGLTYMQARYYDPLLGRFYANDPVGFQENNPLSFNRYAYANNNPYKFVDPDGREVKAIQLKGLTASDPTLKTRTYYVDKQIASDVEAFVKAATEKYPKLSVNNTFRIEDSSKIVTTNTKAKGLSRHQAGFAIDLNGTGTLTTAELSDLRSIAKDNNLGPALKPDADKPHFSADPTDYGYDDLSDAVTKNKQDYLEKIEGKNNEN